MKIPLTNIHIGKKAENFEDVDKRRPASVEILKKIIQTQLIRTKEDISEWRTAINIADSINRPDRSRLTKIYNEVYRDGHIKGIISSIQNRIKSQKFQLEDSEGEEDEDATSIFKQKWFFDLIDYYVEAKFFGYSLIQFGSIVNDTFSKVELIDREYVVPEWSMVKKSLYTTSKDNGVFYNLPPYDKWTMLLGNGDLGLFDVATPHAIGKKNMLIAAWEHGELFGMPFRKGSTDIRDEERRKNMEKMLDNLGRAGWGMFDSDDDLEYIDTSKSDAYKVYLEPMRWSNHEISKAFAGGIGLFDEKSFVGSAETQERLFDDFISAYLRDLLFKINNDLIPLMKYHRIPLEGYKFKWVSEERLSVTEKVDHIVKLSPFYKITPENAKSYTGIELEENDDIDENENDDMNSVMKEVDDLYNKTKGCCDG